MYGVVLAIPSTGARRTGAQPTALVDSCGVWAANKSACPDGGPRILAAASRSFSGTAAM
ncbi:hypothetical protein [Salinispora tropica]|uniref:hypothetical protein n=1 Tax=Salinispora tropica TaxID=168695 RepID=UPI0002E104F7|nr:hypothetical protein [Salinispora tropica]